MQKRVKTWLYCTGDVLLHILVPVSWYKMTSSLPWTELLTDLLWLRLSWPMSRFEACPLCPTRPTAILFCKINSPCGTISELGLICSDVTMIP